WMDADTATGYSVQIDFKGYAFVGGRETEHRSDATVLGLLADDKQRLADDIAHQRFALCSIERAVIHGVTGAGKLAGCLTVYDNAPSVDGCTVGAEVFGMRWRADHARPKSIWLQGICRPTRIAENAHQDLADCHILRGIQ